MVVHFGLPIGIKIQRGEVIDYSVGVKESIRMEKSSIMIIMNMRISSTKKRIPNELQCG